MFLLIILFACHDRYTLDLSGVDTAVGHDSEDSGDTADSGSTDTATDSGDSAEDTGTDTADSGVEETGDTGTEDTATEACGPYVIEGSDHVMYTVTSMLYFTLNPATASGPVSGSVDVITVDATALCGDIVLTDVNFYFSGSDTAGTEWINQINNVVSGISYDYDGHGTFEGFGAYSTRSVTYSNTAGPQRAMWPVTFTEPIIIPKDTTFTFSLSIQIGGTDGLQPAADDFFFARLTTPASWYGTDNPSLYPAATVQDGIGDIALTLEE